MTRDSEMCADIWEHVIESRAQLQEDWFGSLVRTNFRTGQLVSENYLVRHYCLPPAVPLLHRSQCAIYSLGANAIPLVMLRLGLDAATVKQRIPSSLLVSTVLHLLKVKDFNLVVKRGVKAETGNWHIGLWRAETAHAFEFRPSPAGQYRQTMFKPDAVLVLLREMASGSKRLVLPVEVDLGTVSRERWIQKGRVAEMFVGSRLCSDHYGEGVGRVLVATSSIGRREYLLGLAREHSHHRHMFATFDDLEHAGFFAKVWHTAGHPVPISVRDLISFENSPITTSERTR